MARFHNRVSAVISTILFALLIATSAYAQSQRVVVIGGTTLDTGTSTDANQMTYTGGGKLPVSSTADPRLGAFAFSAMSVAAVSTATLAGYDTAVLNLATSEFQCNTGKLSAAQKADVIAFVGSGKKLLVYDSECAPVDYSWIPYPFSTANPGARGAHGTLTIVEENTLSSKTLGNPYYINAGYLGSNTDAVGDMNVMITYDARWCLDMSGTNAIGKTGPVHTYAKYPSATDAGLIIYNGLDMDYLYSNNAELRKIWIFELQQPFNPSNLPCGFTVVGITLTPAAATNIVGTQHTMTAKLADLLGNPTPGTQVTFSIVSGPNAGILITCNTANCVTDANGEVKFTYTSSKVGTDTIEASFLNQGQVVKSQQATKKWDPPPTIDVAVDIKPTSCPNPINIGSKGVQPLAILGMSGFDVSKIDPTTVRLEGVSPLRWSLEDVATPYLPIVGKQGPLACNQLSGDGYMDLVFHFDSEALSAALKLPVVDGEVRVLRISGYLKQQFGGTKIEGEDVVILLVKK